MEFIDRKQFGADVAVTIPALLKEKGKDAYINQIIPGIIHKLNQKKIGQVSVKGIYVNILIPDQTFFETLSRFDASRPVSDFSQPKKVVIEYSSPNVAKELHAGHIRSTILGEALSGIYEALGYEVVRLNYVNDWGGFGYLLEGVRRWPDATGEEVYARFRKLEEEGGAPFEEFKMAAEARFRKLEAGDEEEEAIWKRLVKSSLAKFNLFYERFGIKFDEIKGESYYAKRGAEIVKEGLSKGQVEIEDGAAKLFLGKEDALVIRKSDGSSIYSTRDLAAIEERARKYNPEKIIYVVGQEQTDYFRKLFLAARKLGLAPIETELIHLPFGFYIKAEDKKKLSSRQGAEGVEDLLKLSTEHFKDERVALGSIFFNEIKKERRFPVEFYADLNKNIKEFENGGGAYVMYSAIRAKSILRRYEGVNPDNPFPLADSLAEIEIKIIKRLNQFDEALFLSAARNEPSVLTEYLLRLAQDYNYYYENFKVLEDGKLLLPHRFIITQKVADMLEKGLKICHIYLPERM